MVLNPDCGSILFVCLGNICRSPAVEGVMRHRVEQRGLADRIAIDSAGTIGYHAGKPADPRMRAAARRRGYDLTSRARRVERADLDQYDLIVAMDANNLADLRALHPSPRAEIRMLGSFSTWADPDDPPNVPDPYYGGDSGFEAVLDMIEKACDPVIDHVLRSLGSPAEGAGDA